MNTTKRIAFRNMYESSIIEQSFLYANIPAECLSYAPTFFSDPSYKLSNEFAPSHGQFFISINFTTAVRKKCKAVELFKH